MSPFGSSRGFAFRLYAWEQPADQLDEHGHGSSVGELLAELDDLRDDCRVPVAAPGASAADRSQWNQV